MFSLAIDIWTFIYYNLSFQALSIAQLDAFGPDNAAMVTSKQHAALTQEQCASLQKAAIGSRDQSASGELKPILQSRKRTLTVETALLFKIM